MNIDTAVTIWIRCDPATAFNGASSTDGLPKIFPGKGPIPGVIDAAVVGGGPIATGKVRRVHTTDGAELDETYIQFEPPTAYAYEMTKMKRPLSLLMTKATGSWKFSPEENGTRIHWTYSSELSNPIAAPLTALVIKVFMKGAMNDCLNRLKADIEGKA